jgi:hypothetical protein
VVSTESALALASISMRGQGNNRILTLMALSGDAKILFNKTRTTQGTQTKGRRTTSANSQDSPRTEQPPR